MRQCRAPLWAMVTGWLLLTGGAGSTAGALAAAGGRCADMAYPVTVNFSAESGDVRLNHRLNVTGIANLMTSRGMSGMISRTRSLGVTYAETKFNLSAGSRVRAESDGSYCVALAELTAEFGFERMEVYIAREFAYGSCQYNAILDHENQHVSINQAVLEDFAPLVRAALEREVAKLTPVRVADASDGVNLLLTRLQARLDGLAKAFHDQRDARNAAIDTVENYRALGELCPAWLR